MRIPTRGMVTVRSWVKFYVYENPYKDRNVSMCASVPCIEIANTKTDNTISSPHAHKRQGMSTAALQKINCLIGRKWLQLPLVAMELLMIDVINKAGAFDYWIQAKRHIMRGGRDRERER